MSMDAKAFFDQWRAAFGKLSPAEVDGINALLAEMEARGWTDPRWWAYVLATAHHETAGTMQPLREYARGKGRFYGVADPETGETYYGRGFVQLTWRDNYEKQAEKLGLPLVTNPDLALVPATAAAIMCGGMERGDFTGKCLADYFDADTNDPRNARRIVNGTDKMDLIAGYFTRALRAVKAGLGTMKPPLVDQPNGLPTRKMGAVAIAGGVLTYIVQHQAEVALIPGIGGFVPMIVGLAPILPFVFGYLTRERQ
jgi:putative chitinase